METFFLFKSLLIAIAFKMCYCAINISYWLLDKISNSARKREGERGGERERNDDIRSGRAFLRDSSKFHLQVSSPPSGTSLLKLPIHRYRCTTILLIRLKTPRDSRRSYVYLAETNFFLADTAQIVALSRKN